MTSFSRIALLTVAATISGTTASGQVEIADVQVGVSGFTKVGSWTPVAITLRGGTVAQSLRVELTALDGEAIPCVHVDAQPHVVDFSNSGPKTMVRYVRWGRMRPELHVALTAGDQIIAERELALPASPRIAKSTDLAILICGALPNAESAARRLGT
ncbi:MAG: hypothetical protein KDA60_18735, partial [Planctomycetales bacterium]|nr:hypothetical protein [Planctomycetales bacterium]